MTRENSQNRLSPKKLLRGWQRRKKKLLKTLPALVERCRATGRAELVHELRVTLRRLRFYLRLGRSLLSREDVLRFCGWARRISKASSPVRDLDVALEWLQGRSHAEEVSERILGKRAKAWRRLAAALKTPNQKLLNRLQRTKNKKKAREKLARRYKNVQLRVLQAVCRDARGFFDCSEEQRHRIRRLIRRWRYLRELVVPRRSASKDKLMSVLVELQEAVGVRRNLMLAEDALKRFRNLPGLNDLRRALGAEQALATGRIRAAFRALAPFCPKNA